MNLLMNLFQKAPDSLKSFRKTSRLRTTCFPASYSMDIPPPTLTLLLPRDRSYGDLLHQTKTVYDNLLLDKHTKMSQVLTERTTEYHARYAELQSQDQDAGREFGEKAQATVERLRSEMRQELLDLKADYQSKLNKMNQQMEMNWQEKHLPDTKGKEKEVPCTIYKHK